MKGHGRLLRGQTPPQLVDEVLARRIERLGTEVRVGGRRPAAVNAKAEWVADELAYELEQTRQQLRVAKVIMAVQVLALLVAFGLRLAGV